ncbi:uncharacterized protein BO97DRAFT_422221 [Aspergillus homomorphus CBS 101889]|uniref:Uncharacterized protein n=1 Tax=Aspergillus homomorphus (strain CBS 101889) TaxID=1450537 RepID=A0A395I4G1_ASPHC|nr:hypothetical protein BO97DRAFT_422221 [Aspergillus homomorphus CBS 101889]RAL14867.1 hypothetical protein BO97DRAFT_422221 [Aspergillus homomorphus CBS 101889]
MSLKDLEKKFSASPKADHGSTRPRTGRTPPKKQGLPAGKGQQLQGMRLQSPHRKPDASTPGQCGNRAPASKNARHHQPQGRRTHRPRRKANSYYGDIEMKEAPSLGGDVKMRTNPSLDGDVDMLEAAPLDTKMEMTDMKGVSKAEELAWSLSLSWSAMTFDDRMEEAPALPCCILSARTHFYTIHYGNTQV